jgi:hypothetical protein
VAALRLDSRLRACVCDGGFLRVGWEVPFEFLHEYFPHLDERFEIVFRFFRFRSRVGGQSGLSDGFVQLKEL